MHVVQAIPMTPIRIKVDPSHDASKVKAEGPGLSRSGKTRLVAKKKFLVAFFTAILVILGTFHFVDILKELAKKSCI